MEKNFIVVTIVKSNNSENNVWAVAVTGEEQPQGFCKSAYKAMRFAFLLKKRTGLNIDDQSLKSLSLQIAELKAQKAEAKAGKEKPEVVALAGAESQSAEAVQPEQLEAQAEQPKPKKQRKPRAKKNAEVASVIAFQ